MGIKYNRDHKPSWMEEAIHSILAKPKAGAENADSGVQLVCAQRRLREGKLTDTYKDILPGIFLLAFCRRQ